jgi:hypothetical protein
MNLPPRQLHAPPRLVRTLLTPIWASLLLLALITQLGGTWVTFSDYYRYNPRFAQLGLISYGGLHVAGAPGVDETQAIRSGSMITGLNCPVRGACSELDPKTTYEELSDLLEGPMGSSVTVRFLDQDNAYIDLPLVRTEEHQRTASPGWLFVIDRIVLPLLGMLAAGFGLFVSTMMWKKRDDPVAPLLAFGLIGLVLSGDATDLFWQWAIPDSAIAALPSSSATLLAFAFLNVAMPAFPDGRYRPAWGGWVALCASLVAMLLFGMDLYIFEAVKSAHPILIWLDSLLAWAFVALTLVAIFAATVRFRTIPPGLEKQKVKWAALGLIFGLLAIAFANIVQDNVSLDGLFGFVFDAVFDLVRAIGMVAIPLGILMSLMEIRLNDADRVIGRSAGYAMITLLIGAIWAASANWINASIGNQVSPAAAAGISAMVAAAIFVPARERILKWTEKLLQPAMVKLRSLPAKILPWREDHTPADVGKGTLLAIVNGIHATSAALVLTEEGGDKVIATYEVTADRVMEDLARDEAEQRVFPLRVRLVDLCGPVGFLLIGPRSDGASYRSDEKDAVALVAGPLADVLRATSRRAGRALALTQMLTAVDARIARLETMRASVSS